MKIHCIKWMIRPVHLVHKVHIVHFGHPMHSELAITRGSMYKLFLATPEGVVFEDMVHSTSVPGTEGFFQVLTNHAAIISSLQRGDVVVIDKDQKKKTWRISGGYFTMSHNEATLLADSIT